MKIGKHLKAYSASGISLILASGSQLVTFALLARHLGVQEFSLFVSLSAVTNVAFQLCAMGGGEALIRRVSQDRAMYPRMLGHNLTLGAISGTLLLVAGVLILPRLFPLSADPVWNYEATALFLLANIVFMRGVYLAEQAYLGHSMYRQANMVVVCFALARMVAAALATLVFTVETTASWAVWQAATHFTAAAVALWTARHLGAPVFGLVNIETRNGFFFGIPLFVRGFRANVDIMALGLVASHEVIASYGLARRIMEIGYLPVDALHRLVYPKSAALAAQGLRATWTNVKRIVTITIGIAALTALALWIGAPVLPYIFGHDYVTMPHFVQWMCFGLIMIALWVAPLEAVGSAGHHALRASLIATGAIVGVSSVFWAVQYWPTDGVIGAFWLTECTIAILAWIVYGRLIRRSDGKPAHTQATSHA